MNYTHECFEKNKYVLYLWTTGQLIDPKDASRKSAWIKIRLPWSTPNGIIANLIIPAVQMDMSICGLNKITNGTTHLVTRNPTLCTSSTNNGRPTHYLGQHGNNIVIWTMKLSWVEKNCWASENNNNNNNNNNSSSIGECGLFSKQHDDRMTSRYSSFLIFTPAALWIIIIIIIKLISWEYIYLKPENKLQNATN